eukprot:633822-Lingulodinium_polyedra.AAC.1
MVVQAGQRPGAAPRRRHRGDGLVAGAVGRRLATCLPHMAPRALPVPRLGDQGTLQRSPAWPP